MFNLEKVIKSISHLFAGRIKRISEADLIDIVEKLKKYTPEQQAIWYINYFGSANKAIKGLLHTRYMIEKSFVETSSSLVGFGSDFYHELFQHLQTVLKVLSKIEKEQKNENK